MYSQEVRWSQSETSIRAGFFSACCIALMSSLSLEIMWKGFGVPDFGLSYQRVFLKAKVGDHVLNVDRSIQSILHMTA